jgi:hypothetical protein
VAVQQLLATKPPRHEGQSKVIGASVIGNRWQQQHGRFRSVAAARRAARSRSRFRHRFTQMTQTAVNVNWGASRIAHASIAHAGDIHPSHSLAANEFPL